MAPIKLTLNDRAYNMLSKGFLMNDFLESFLMTFGQNKYIKLKRYWTFLFFFSQNRFSLKSL